MVTHLAIVPAFCGCMSSCDVLTELPHSWDFLHSGHLELPTSSQIPHNTALQASPLRYVSCDLVSVAVHMPVEGTLFNWLSFASFIQ